VSDFEVVFEALQQVADRHAREQAIRAADRIQAESLRLRSEQDNAGFIPWRGAQDHIDELRAEIASLRFAAENAHQDIERWRKALETIQELAATSSLRVFHTIASDALGGLPAK
jgi:hypothetical protein